MPTGRAAEAVADATGRAAAEAVAVATGRVAEAVAVATGRAAAAVAVALGGLTGGRTGCVPAGALPIDERKPAALPLVAPARDTGASGVRAGPLGLGRPPLRKAAAEPVGRPDMFTGRTADGEQR